MGATGGTPSAGGMGATGGTASVGGRMSVGGRTNAGGRTGSGGNADAGASDRDAGSVPVDASPADAGGLPEDAEAPDAADSAPRACSPSQTPLTAGDHTTTLQHGGRSRKYTLHVPSGVTGAEPLAVVFDLHGAGGTGLQQKQMSGWGAVADRDGFLTVFPDGLDGYWNVDDKCCGTAGAEKIDDVGFIRAIVDQLSAETCIDPRRIYVSGFSNGGGLTHRIGCDAADVIAAIAPVDTDLRTLPCNAARSISMMEFRGLADTLEPYEGGVVGNGPGQYTSPGAQGSLKLWADLNQCTGTPTTIDEYCESYTECEDGVETDLCSLPNAGHGSYRNSLNFDIAAVAWKMFQRQPMR
jgi:polyhydroxybutyrate depolymerase